VKGSTDKINKQKNEKSSKTKHFVTSLPGKSHTTAQFNNAWY